MLRTIAAALVLATLLAPPGPVQAAPAERLVLVPEMERPPGILYEPSTRRRELQEAPEAGPALQSLRKQVAVLWPEVQKVDLAALSRYHVELTRDWRLPSEPGPLEGQVVGRDEATGRLYLELRGPRLPARYEIVHRHLHFYASFEPGTGHLGPVVVTIRGWVLE